MRQLTTAVVSPVGLAVARILVGLASVPMVLEWWAVLQRVASDDYLAIPSFSWMPSPGPDVVRLLASVALLGSALLVVGLLGRLGAGLVSLTSASALALDQQAYSNHLVLLVCLTALLALAQCDRTLSFPPRPRTSLVPYWPVFLFKLQISTVYLYTALAKVNDQYLSGEVIANHQSGLITFPANLLPLVAAASIAAEAGLAVALWIPKLRLAATVVGACLHLSILFVFDETYALAPFAILMLAGYVLFWVPVTHPEVHTKNRPAVPSVAAPSER